MSDAERGTRAHGDEELDRLPIEGALEAPMLFFDEVAGVAGGTGSGSFLLCAFVHETDDEGAKTTRRKAVAHIVGNHQAVEKLRSAITRFEHLVAPSNLTN